MNLSIYIDNDLAKKVQHLAEKMGETRNAIVAQAVRAYVAQAEVSEWPQAVVELAGADKRLVPFEKWRDELRDVAKDPLG